MNLNSFSSRDDDEDNNNDDTQTVLAANNTVVTSAAMAAALAVASLMPPTNKRQKRDHRTLPRNKRREFRHNEALQCIHRDYLGVVGDPSTPLLGSEFKLMFRLSRGRFQVLMEDIKASNYPFFMSSDQDGISRSSIEARLLLPLKTLAYGVPPHTFIDYFQMSPQYASDCCKHFCKAVKLVYQKEFLRCPTKTDMNKITKLHKVVHDTEGLFGSLDCTHTFWKNCPKAWHGSYTGKEKKPSIVLEAACDYHLFFWHASYGYTGTINDITILSLSPLFDMMIDGTLHDIETQSGSVPFTILEEQFTNVFLLVDGIYPSYSRFVRGIKHPITQQEKKYTAWQEACRKDIERAFGVLKGAWQCLDRPFLLHHVADIADRVACCLLLHNILVTDRVMDGNSYNFRERYDPTHMIEEDVDGIEVQQPSDLRAVQAREEGEPVTVIGVGNLPSHVQQVVTKKERFNELNDREENRRLHLALMSKFGGN